MRRTVIVLGVFLSLAALAWAQHGGHGAGGTPAHGGPAAGPFVLDPQKPYGEAMHEAMGVMERDMAQAPMTGDPDLDFAAMMIPHHQGAIDMARLVLLHGKDPEIRALAEAVVTAQEKEIAFMKGWMERRRQERSREFFE